MVVIKTFSIWKLAISYVNIALVTTKNLFVGVAILITFKAMDAFPAYFLIKNRNKPKFDTLLRIVGFVNVSMK